MDDPRPAATLHALPIPRTRLIGREAEQNDARRRLLDEASALVSLVGTGGVGKTHLALVIARHVAGHFADGVVWLDLSSINDDARVPPAVAQALGLQADTSDAAHESIRALRGRQLLLILDNCEQVIDGAASLAAALLASCPALQILATSRTPLRLRGEQVLRVNPFPLPGSGAADLAALGENSALQLFLERGRAVRPDLDLRAANASLLIEIVRRLDGLPLALELAAARLRFLTPEALLDQLQDRLRLLRDGPRDAPRRQQALQDTIAWSYGLLTPTRQQIFRQLAVFSGGCTLEAAAFVCDLPPAEVLDHLYELADLNLIVVANSSGQPRFTMLETIHEFAAAILATAGDQADPRRRHAAYYGRLLDRASVLMLPYLPDAAPLLAQLNAEYANFRAALDWLRQEDDASSVLALASRLYYVWQLGGPLGDAREWLEWGLRAGDVSPRDRLDGMLALAAICYAQDVNERGHALCRECIAGFSALGDDLGTALTLHLGSFIAMALGQPALAATYLDEIIPLLRSLPGIPGQEGMLANLPMYQGWVAFLTGDTQRANDLLTSVLARKRPPGIGVTALDLNRHWTLLNLAHVTRARGEPLAALAHYQGALAQSWQVQEVRVCARALTGIAGILVLLGHGLDAAQFYGAAEAFCARRSLEFRALWDFERAFGVPDFSTSGEDALGAEAQLVRASVLQQGPIDVPSLPATEHMQEAWRQGQIMPFDLIVARALAVDSAPDALECLDDDNRGGDPVSPTMASLLTRREHDVLTRLDRRLTDQEIADDLFISLRTVNHHVASILGKLGAANRREAVARARNLSLCRRRYSGSLPTSEIGIHMGSFCRWQMGLRIAR